MFEEHKYEELKKLGTELHIPIFEAFLKLEVFDKDGNLVQEHNQRSHSWVRNAYNMMFCQMGGLSCPDSTFGAGLLSVKETDGTINYGIYSFGQISTQTLVDVGVGYRAAATNDTQGILVGTGTGAESFEDYVLGALVADGTGAGQLSYIETPAPTITYTAGTKVFKVDWLRYFNNNSGGSIVIAEVAAVGNLATPSNYNLVMDVVMSRDLLGATVTIADTGQLKATYTIQITFAG